MTEPVPPQAVVPRPAASLVVLRDDGAVLMGVRGARHRFMPNRLVFPGGAVDPGDHGVDPATPLRADVLHRLERSASPGLARALGIAAARELEEETGLTLGLPPSLEGLDYLCRAVTPEPSPVRFDARFLVVEADRIAGVLAGSGELEALRWWGIDEALAIDLAGPQRRVLERLRLWMAMSEQERRAQTEVAVLFNRGWEKE
jgi:8-oxo-dGTP pyrophosphatase MutT (NUDIX family)